LTVQLVRYFAGARAAAGVAEEKLVLTTVQDLVVARPELARVLTACSFLVDGLAWHDRSAPLPADAIVDVLPPFAGG
jgi:molybdopterin synthase sulfur carrier subunit